jgi:hypothetical protein
MERPMAFDRIRDDPGHRIAGRGPNRLVAVADALMPGTALALLLVVLLPLHLVLPTLSVLSFVFACALALYALRAKARREATRAWVWDAACVFAGIWVVSGLLGNPKHLLEWVERLAAAS